MTTPQEKALLQFPGVYVTLVSVVQAITLEVLVSRFGELGLGLSLTWESAIVWLEIALLGQTIFYVWVSYTLLVILAQWVLRVFDFAAAFGVGLLQLVSVGWIGIDTTRQLFFVIAIGFFAGAWISHSNTGAAAARPENAEVMATLPTRRISVLLAVVGALGTAGFSIGGRSVGALVVVFGILVLCNGVLLAAQLQWFRWWNQVTRPSPGTTS
jgi:hypothetical protein